MAGPSNSTTAGIIGRWRPVHRGHQAVLRALCRRYAHVMVGVGSANVLDVRNPFTLKETCDMLRLALDGQHNYTLVPIDDLPSDEDWCDLMDEHFTKVTDFYSANPFVHSLLHTRFPVSHPAGLLAADEKVRVSGTEVRRRLARGLPVDDLLPPSVHDYLCTHQLDERFRQDYGLHTLALETIIVA